MGLWQRFTLIFKSKANSALNKAEDPRQTLDYSYEKQLELLQKVRRGVADVATSRKRLELQIQGLNQQEAKLEGQARAALAAGREDLAREALTRRSGLHQQIEDLQIQLAQLQEQEEKLTVAAQQLQSRVESFRTRKETIKATYSAAEAQTKINEAVAGISSELGDVGLAVQRAEEKTAEMQADLRAKLERGRVYTVRVTAPGFNDAEIQVKGGDARGFAKLTSKPRAVEISSEPTGAMIFIDGGNSGFTTPYTLDLADGRTSLKITLRKNGFKAVDRVVGAAKFVAEGDKLVAKVSETLAPATAAPAPTGTDGGGASGGSGEAGPAGSPDGAKPSAPEPEPDFIKQP